MRIFILDNIKTIKMLSYFLNCKLDSNKFKFNKDNKWSSSKKFMLSKEQIIQINNTFFFFGK